MGPGASENGARPGFAAVYPHLRPSYDGPADALPGRLGAVSDTEVQIPDEPGGQPAGDRSPYQNLWVPLVVVPAGIVMAIVVIVALFGNLAGDERTPVQNLELVASGGKNERTQALMGLAQQAAANERARQESEELPYPYPANFGRRVMEVLDGLDEDDHDARTALGAFLAGLERPPEAAVRGVEELVAILALGEREDPDGRLRDQALLNLGLLARGPDTPADAAAPAVYPLLEDGSPHVRMMAAAVLANIGGDRARSALEEALSDSNLSVRATAAFSLAKLDPPGVRAAPVLRELTTLETYEQARALDPSLFTRAEGVSQLRIKAVQSLAKLDREEDWEHIASLSDAEDLNLRAAVLELLAEHGEAP